MRSKLASRLSIRLMSFKSASRDSRMGCKSELDPASTLLSISLNANRKSEDM